MRPRHSGGWFPSRVKIHCGVAAFFVFLLAFMVMPDPARAQLSSTDPCAASGGTTTPPVVQQGADWPNQPAGAPVVAECDFENSKDCGVFQGYYGGGGLTTLPDAPYSPNGVFYNFMAAGASSGNGYGLAYQGSRNMKDIYAGFYWKMNADFEGYVTANKLFFLRDFGNSDPACNTNGVWTVAGNDGIDARNFPFTMVFSHNTGGGVNNSHACPADPALGLVCFPNVSNTPIKKDQWYLVEAYVKASTCGNGPNCPPGGSRDGIVRWWIDGVLQGDYTNMNYGCGTVNEFLIDHTWDGQLAAQCRSDTGDYRSRDCSKEWRHYFDHVRVAAPDCPGGCPVTGSAAGPECKKTCDTYELYEFPPDCTPSAGTFSPTGDYGPHWTLSKKELDSLTVSCKPGFCGKIEFIVVPKQSW